MDAMMPSGSATRFSTGDAIGDAITETRREAIIAAKRMMDGLLCCCYVLCCGQLQEYRDGSPRLYMNRFSTPRKVMFPYAGICCVVGECSREGKVTIAMTFLEFPDCSPTTRLGFTTLFCEEGDLKSDCCSRSYICGDRRNEKVFEPIMLQPRC